MPTGLLGVIRVAAIASSLSVELTVMGPPCSVEDIVGVVPSVV